MKIGNIEVYGVIYKITNMINGKCYIGQTTYGFDRRYFNDLSKHSHNKHLKNAIEKYGIENFEIIKIFDIAFSKEELDIKEKHYIKIFNCYTKGYNQTLGGEGTVGLVRSEESKEKMKKARQDWWDNLTEEDYKKWRENLYIAKGENNPFYGVRRYGKENPFYGKHHTEENKKKHSLDISGENNYWYGKKGKDAPNTKSVICITTNMVFDTVKEACKYYNCSNIDSCCRGFKISKGKKINIKSAGKLPDGTKLVWKYITIIEL